MRTKQEEILNLGHRVFVKELGVSGTIYERARSESGLDWVYGVRLDEVAYPKNFVATVVWHCIASELILAVEPLIGVKE